MTKEIDMTQAGLHHTSRQAERFHLAIYDADLNLVEAGTDDGILTGRQLAEMPTPPIRPAAEARVLHLQRPGSVEDIGPEETVRLSRANNTFFIGRSDRLYSAIVDDSRIDWLSSKIGARIILLIMDLDPEKYRVVRVRTDTADEPLPLDAMISLEGSGVEAFRTERIPQFVTACINGEREVKLPVGIYLVSKLLELLGIDPRQVLNVVGPDGSFEELEPEDKFTVDRDLKFISQPPCGGAA
ncbi:MAG: hypothetical protein V7741_00240 [Hyphomonas sp.]